MHVLFVPLFFALLIAFLALFVAISLMTLRYATADLGTQWIGRDPAIRVYISDVFALVTLFGAVSSAMLLGKHPESTRAWTVAIAAFLAITMWMFSVWLLSQSQVNRPTKRFAFFLVSGPCTLFLVANWWAILAVAGSMIAEGNRSRSWHLVTLMVLQASVIPVRGLNKWIASPDETTRRPQPATLAEIEKLRS